MKLLLKNGNIDTASNEYVRVELVEESKEFLRLVRENGVNTLEIGIGKKEIDPRQFITLCRSIVRFAKSNKCKKLALQFDRLCGLLNRSQEYAMQVAAENFEIANFDFNVFKSKPKEGWNSIDEILLFGKFLKCADVAVRKGHEVGKAVNDCRTLANTPGGNMTPTALARAARDAVRGLPVSVSTLGEKDMRKLSMGAILGVAKGSTEPPTFTIMKYLGSKGSPIVLIGKGVTFDSGGLNLKQSNNIHEMHMDMSGAAAVISAVALSARLKLKKHVIGIIPAVENMPGNNAYRPGDILTSLSRKTIEVLSTDAEGRLILADALTYSKRFRPSVVIDIATLTGAVISALGLYASGLLTRDESLSEKLIDAAELSGDYIWRLPLWDEYEDRVKGTFADLKNVPDGSTSRYGGAIDGGMFLWQFAKDLGCPWAHLDIASRMTSAPGDNLSKGATGASVRLLIRFIEQWTD